MLVRAELSDRETAEERRLWADYYEAVARIPEIMRREGTPEAQVLSQILAEHVAATSALARIKQIRGIR